MAEVPVNEAPVWPEETPVPEDTGPHAHRLETILNLIATLAEDGPGGDDAARISQGEFCKVFSKLFLSGLPTESGTGNAASSYLHAISTVKPESATTGGVHEINDMTAALDSLQEKMVAYHEANLEALAPSATQEIDVQSKEDWDKLGTASMSPNPTHAFTYHNNTSLDGMESAASALADAGRIHVPNILSALAKVSRSIYPNAQLTKLEPLDALAFTVDDHISTNKSQRPVIVVQQRTPRVQISGCPFPADTVNPFLKRLENLMIFLLTTSSMNALAQAVLLLRSATVVGLAQCQAAIRDISLFGPSATLANLNDEVEVCAAPISDEYRQLMRQHTEQLVKLRRQVLNSSAKYRQILLNRTPCASLALHKTLCGPTNSVNFSVLYGSLMYLSRNNPKMVALMNLLQRMADVGFNANGLTTPCPDVIKAINDTNKKFNNYRAENTSAGPDAEGDIIGDDPTAYAFQVLHKALGLNINKALKLAEQEQIDPTMVSSQLANLETLRSTIDSSITSLDSHLIARNRRDCPTSAAYTLTRRDYDDTNREKIQRAISALTALQSSQNSVLTNKAGIFSATAPRWSIPPFSGAMEDWGDWWREFNSVFGELGEQDPYVYRQLVGAIADPTLRDMVRSKENYLEAVDFLKRRFQNKDNEISRLIHELRNLTKPKNGDKQKELANYLKMEQLHNRLCKVGGADQFTRYFIRELTENIVPYKVRERYNKKIIQMKSNKRKEYQAVHQDITEDQIMASQNDNHPELSLTNEETAATFWQVIQEAIIYLEEGRYINDCRGQLFGTANKPGGTPTHHRQPAYNRSGSLNNLSTEPTQSTSWAAATNTPKPKDPPICRWKICRDKGGKASNHTLFRCGITTGSQKTKDSINKMIQDSGLCKLCARLTQECGGNCQGVYTLKDGTRKSGLCEAGCSATNRLFCSHSKLAQAKAKQTPTHLATMHIPPATHSFPTDTATEPKLPLAITSGSMWTMTATPSPTGNPFSSDNNTPLNCNAFTTNSQLTDMAHVSSTKPNAIIMLVRLLIDSGADVSYICANWADAMGFDTTMLDTPYSLPTAGGGLSIVSKSYLIRLHKHDGDVLLLKAHGVNNLTRRYSSMHLEVPQDILTEFKVTPDEFAQPCADVSIILGADSWRFVAPDQIRRNKHYMLYRSILSGKLMLAGGTRTEPGTHSQNTLLGLNNLKGGEGDEGASQLYETAAVCPEENNSDIFSQRNQLDINIAHLEHTLCCLHATEQHLSTEEYVRMGEQKMRLDLNTAPGPAGADASPSLHVISQMNHSSPAHTATSRKSRHNTRIACKNKRSNGKNITFCDDVKIITCDDQATKGQLANEPTITRHPRFSQNSSMRHAGKLFTLELAGDLWSQHEPAPVRRFFERYGCTFDTAFAPIRDCQDCNRKCQKCLTMSTRLDPGAMLEYSLFWRNTIWLPEKKIWLCNPVLDQEKLKRLGNSRNMVKERMEKLDTKASRLQQKDRDSLNDCINKALQQGALKPSDHDPKLSSCQKNWIPGNWTHGGSETTPVRVCWDNSAKVSADATSLNECQLLGCQLNSMFRCNSYIRSFRYFCSVDLSKAFWNLHIPVHAQSLHRVFLKVRDTADGTTSVLGEAVGDWREFVMTTFSFGDRSATSHLSLCLAKGVVKFGLRPDIARKVLLFCYVDNIHISSSSKEELAEWETELNRFFADMCWKVHPWVRSFDLPEPPVTLDHAAPEHSVIKLLGYYHDANNDTFQVRFSVNLGKMSRNKKLSPDLQPGDDVMEYIKEHGLTRRTALRLVGACWDYSGHTLSLQVSARLCFREALLMNKNAAWDQQFTMETKQMYCGLLTNIMACNGHSFPRAWVPRGVDHVINKECPHLVAFCDGSMVASSCRVFLVTQPSNSKCREVHLVNARAQIAPLKLPASTALSVPKMETNAIWIASRVVDEIRQNFEIPIKTVTTLTDSETSFFWSQASPLFLDKYVAGKVKTIQALLDTRRIFHIASDNNRADASSKYQQVITKETLRKEVEPGWMQHAFSEWPIRRLPLNPQELPGVLSKYSACSTDVFNPPGGAILPQTMSQTAEDPEALIQAFNLEPRLMNLTRDMGGSVWFDRALFCNQLTEGEDEHTSMDGYNDTFGPDAYCSVMMPEDRRERFLATSCLQYEKPSQNLQNLMRTGFKPLVSTYLSNRARDRGAGWQKHPWSDEIPQIKASLAEQDPEVFAELLMSHTNHNKVIRILANCLRFGRRCRKVETRDDVVPIQAHYITIRMILHQQALNKVKLHMSSQVLSERFFVHNGIMKIHNRKFKNQADKFEETSTVVSAKSAVGISMLLHAHYHDHGHLTSPNMITSRFRAGTPSYYFPFAEKLLESIKQHCLYCHAKTLQTARQVEGLVPEGRLVKRAVFETATLDGAGPFIAVRGAKGREEQYKLWIYIWVCQASSLIHITMAEDLSAAQVFLGLAELQSTYGKVRRIHADGQSAFRLVARKHREKNGAPGELHEPDDERERAIVLALQIQACKRYGQEQGIVFDFGAPRSPNFQSPSELTVGQIKKLLYMSEVADVAPEIRVRLSRASTGEVKGEYELVQMVLDCSGLTVLQYQALFKKYCYFLNNRPWYVNNECVFSRFHLLHTRQDHEADVDHLADANMLDTKDKAYAQFMVGEALLNAMWDRYLLHLVGYLEKANQARWPALDSNMLRPGTVILFKDRITKAGKLEVGIIQEAIKPHPGDAQRRYLVRTAHKKPRSTHPYPIESDTVSHSILERDSDNLIRIGHVDDQRPLFYDPDVLLDSPGPAKLPQYPGQAGLPPTATTEPLVYAPRKKRDNKNRFSSKHVRESTPGVKGRQSNFRLDDERDRRPGDFPRYTFPQGGPVQPATPARTDDVPAGPAGLEPQATPVATDGRAPGTRVDTGPEEEDVPVASTEEGGREDVDSALPTSMGPPPALHEIFEAWPVEGPGDRFFQAVATSTILQTMDNQKTFPRRERNNRAKQYRSMAFNAAIGLTFSNEAKTIFAFQEDEEARFEVEMPLIREMLQSFIDKPTQQAVPARFEQDFDHVILMLPRFLAHAIQRPIYVYATQDGIHGNMLRFSGFNQSNVQTIQGQPVMILHKIRVYEAVNWRKQYLDFLPTLEGRVQEDASIVQQDEIQQCLAIVHYLYSFSEEREYI